jgi:hypothetical protein
MNTIGKKFVSATLSLTTITLVLGASFFVPVASAQTSTDLQAQIAALNAQLAQLQGQLGGSGSVQGAVTFTFTRNLTVGSTGSDVQNLQIFLNSKGFVVASSGAGAPGSESTYFGFKTKAALAKFQAANGVSPAVGFFGPITRAKVASMGGVVVTPPGTTNPPGTSAVVLSVDNPAAGTVTTAASQVPLVRFTFNGNYTVTSMVLKRIGVSADTSISNAYLFDRDTQQRLTDGASVSSGSLITFNNPSGLFTVTGNKTISVRVDLAANAGETIGIQLVSFTVSGGSPATVNLSGNLFTVATATLASVSIASSTITGSGNSDPGNDVLLWQGQMTVSTRNVVFNRIALRQMGNINNATDIRNFRLFVDGVVVSTVANLDANGYVTFANLNQTLQTGTRTLKILADVIGGSSRTVQMSLRGNYDINVTDTQYNLSPAVTISGGQFPAGPVAFTVNSGSLIATKATNSPATNVTLNGSDVPLAIYTFTAYGEPVRIQTLTVGAIVAQGVGPATSSLRNGRILVNGTQYGSTANISNAGTSYTTNFTVNPGSPATVEIRSDVFDAGTGNSLSATSTIQVKLVAGSGNGTAQVSLGTVSVPTSEVLANTVSVQSGSLTITKTTSYANQTTIIPQTNYKLADFSITNGNVEDVNVNTMTLTYTASGTFDNTDLQNVYVKYGSNMTTVKASPSTSDAFTVTFTVAKNTTVPIQVYGDIKSGAITTGDAVRVNLAITGTTAASGQSANVAATNGQTIAGVTGGTYTVSLDGTAPNSQIVSAPGSIVSSVAKVQPVNDGLNLTGLTVQITDPSAVSSFDLLFNGSVVRSAIPAATSVAVTGLNVNVPANTNGILSARLNLSGVGVGLGTTGANLTTNLNNFTGTSPSTGASASITGSASGTAIYAYKAVPVIARGTNGVSTVLGAGTKTVADFTITPVGGTIGWRTLQFAIATSTASTTVGNGAVGSTLYDVTAGNYVTLSAATSSGTTFTVIANTEQQLSSAHEYQLNVTISITGGLATGNSMTFQLSRQNTVFQSSNTWANFNPTGAGIPTSTIVWTDQSASAHGLTTTDWTTDFLVSGLPTNTWLLSN